MSVLQRNHVTISGSGEKPVILGHGFGNDQGAWRRVLPFFERSYRVIRYDLTGLGRSDKRAYDYARHSSLRGHADDLLEVCAELGVEGASFVGHSAGGMIGLLAALREPARFDELVLISASPCYVNERGYRGGLDRDQLESILNALASNYGEWCEHTVPLAVGEPVDSDLTRDVLDGFKRVDPAIAQQFTRVVFESDHRAILRDVQQPTLILQPSYDAFVPEDVAHFLARELPRAELKVVAGRGGHYPHLGAPDAVIEAVRSFFDA